MTTTAFYNQNTGNVWVVTADDTVFLRKATSQSDAYTSIGEAGYVRTGNWLPSYGSVVQTTLGN